MSQGREAPVSAPAAPPAAAEPSISGAPGAEGSSAARASRRSRPALLRLVMRLLGPAILVALVLRLDHPASILRPMAHAAPLPLVAALLLNIACNQLKVWRFQALLRARGYVYSPLRAWTSFLSSVYVGMLTPGRVGDVLRVHYLRRDLGLPYPEGVALVVVDRLCDLYVLLGFVAIGIARFSEVVIGRTALVTWAAFALTAISPLVLLAPRLPERLLRSIYRRVADSPRPGPVEPADETAEGGRAAAKPGKGRSPATRVACSTGATEPGGLSAFLEVLRAQSARTLVLPIVLTAGGFAINYVQGWLLARSLHLAISLFDAACLLSVASLLGLLPVSVSGVGVREFFFVLVFPVLGYSAEQGVTFGLLVFGAIYLAIIALGFVSWQLAPPPLGDEARARGADN